MRQKEPMINQPKTKKDNKMATKVQDLVKAIQEGKSSAIQSTFDAAVAEKVQSHIESFRANVIENTFNEATAYDANLGKDKKAPVYAEGVKGAKSTPFKKKFKSQEHYAKWTDSDEFGNHEVHRVYNESEIGQDTGGYVVEDYSDMDLSIDEAAGALAGLPKHAIKALTRRGAFAAGNNSETEKFHANNQSGVVKHIKAGLDANHGVAVYVNDKLHKVANPSSFSYGRTQKYGVHNSDKQEKTIETHRTSGTKYNPSRTYQHASPEISKGDTVDRLIPAFSDKEFYKNNKVEVVHIKPDAKRAIKQDRRKEASKGQNSDIAKIQDTAATKLAQKTLGQKESPVAVAAKLHKELGDHIASGDHRKAKTAADALAAHVQQHGLAKDHPDTARYAEALKGLQNSGSYMRTYDRKTLQRLKAKNESEEGVDELIEALDNLEEISAKALGSYVKKASVDASNLQATAAADRENAKSAPKAKSFHLGLAKKALTKSGKRLDGISTAVKKMTEEEEIEELSGATLGSYIQKARQDVQKRHAHGAELDATPKVSKLKQKISDLYADRRHNKNGDNIHRKKINSLQDKEKEEKKKLDPAWPKSVLTGKRHNGIDKAVNKLQYGKLTEGADTDENIGEQ